MKICKKCGEIAKFNNYVEGYYCSKCGDFISNENLYSEMDIYREWLEYKYLCYSPEELRKIISDNKHKQNMSY